MLSTLSLLVIKALKYTINSTIINHYCDIFVEIKKHHITVKWAIWEKSFGSLVFMQALYRSLKEAQSNSNSEYEYLQH